MHIRNSCDIAGICPNSQQLTHELRAAKAEVHELIIDSLGRQEQNCSVLCGSNSKGSMDPLCDPFGWSFGLRHHLQWPSAWTEFMFDFFRSHPLSTSPQ